MKVSRIVIAGTAALAVWGVLGTVPSAAQTSSVLAAAIWTRQGPVASPSAREDAAMAYDAATGTIVLFGGGTGAPNYFSGTWTWDGTTWTRRAPAVQPPARSGAVMVYDAATGTVVLFGGINDSGVLADTWTWDGSTWTQQHPPVSPPARQDAAMAYDAATGTAVLFGGFNPATGILPSATWTWNGSTWTRQAPPAHPSGREGAAMAYDAATGTVVLFGGGTGAGISATTFNGTWTWNGSTWTRQAPAASPSSRSGAAMAYDAATGTAVLFGGINRSHFRTHFLAGTWTWNGTTWTKQVLAVHPAARDGAAMAYDTATGSALLFGGFNPSRFLANTWTWG